MSVRLPRQPWMTQRRTAAVLDALDSAGGPGCARFVGGCVRNALLGRPVDDLDIATVLTPQAVIEALKTAGLRALPTGIEHGTVTAISGGRPFEITTLRRDVATDGRRAVVAFTRDWAEDAARRDFTLNALYADRVGELFDPTGLGLDDARDGRIRFVGEPERRIREDYLRILRFFRFQAWYGRGEPDAAALDACAGLTEGLSILAAERISKELLKLLAAEDPRAAMALMTGSGVLAALLPEARGLARLDGLVAVETGQTFACDPELRLAALLPEDPTVGIRLAQRLRLSNALRDRLAAALGSEPALSPAMSPRDVRRAVYILGGRAFADRARLAWADSPPADAPRWRALLAMAETWAPPPLPVNGEDAAAAGLPRGPKVGQALREVERWWIEQDFPDDRAAALARLQDAARRVSP